MSNDELDMSNEEYEEFENLKGLFKPWIGKQYSLGIGYNDKGYFLGDENHRGKKVLILGESHYWGTKCGGEDCKKCSAGQHNSCLEFTRDCMEQYLDQEGKKEGWMNTYLKFERSLTDTETEPSERQSLWRHLAFYNYLQVGLEKSRESIDIKDFKNAEKPFLKILELLTPDYIIAWGCRLWENMTWEKFESCDNFSIEGSDYGIKNGIYKINDKKTAKIMVVYHPSVGYSWDWWYKAIKKFIK